MPLLNYTTTVPAYKTASEIQECLRKHGAKAVMFGYNTNGEIEYLNFIVQTPYGETPFKLPVNTAAVEAVLHKQFPRRRSYSSKGQVAHEQALRCSWRILKDWVEAQMAILEAGMVTMEQVFLPYMTSNGETLYDHLRGNQFKLKSGE